MLGSRFFLGNYLQFIHIQLIPVTFLNYETTGYSSYLQAPGDFQRKFQYSQVLLGLKAFQSLGGISWSDDNFHKRLGRFLGRSPVNRAVQGNNAAKGGQRVSGKGPVEGFLQGYGYRRSTGVGVFNDNTGRFIKFPYQFPGCLGINYVIIGEFLAIQLPGIRQSQPRGHKAVKGSFLMGVLTIAQVINLFPGQNQVLV